MGKKKKENLDAVRRLLRGHEGQRLLRRGDQGAVGHAAAVLRLRLQQGALRGVRPGLLLDRLPQGQLPGRVHGRAAHLGPRRQGQVRDLPQRVPPDEDPGAAARRQRVRGRLHPGRQRHPLRPDRDPQRRRATSSTGSSRPARRRAATTDFNDFMEKVAGAGLQQAGHRVADQGRRLRRHEAPPPGAGRDPRDRRRPVTSTSRSNEAIGQDSLFGGLDDDGDAAFGIAVAIPDIDEWDKTTAARPRARHARPLRLRPPAARPRARALATAPTAPSAS